MKVLLIEDSRIEQRLFEKALYSEFPDAILRTVSTVKDAKLLLGEGNHDVVISDFYLEDGTADELFHLIGSPPLIVITSAEDQTVAIRALRAGAFDFITKEPSLQYLRELPLAVKRAHEFAVNRELTRILSSAMTSTNDAVVVTQVDGIIEYVNRSAEEMFHHSSSEMIEKSFGTLDCSGSAGKLFDRWRDGSTDEFNGESFVSCHDDVELPVRVKFTAIRDPKVFGPNLKGESGHVVVLQDISAEKKAEKSRIALEERLQVAQRLEAFGAISGGVAHDFNNILASILGYLELCVDDAPPATVLHRNLIEIQKASHRARQLVDQVLSAGKGTLKERLPIPLQMTVHEVLNLVKVRLGDKITVEMNFPRPLMLVEADPAELHQIVLNLCTNARDTLLRKGGGKLSMKLEKTALNDIPEDLIHSLRVPSRNANIEIAVLTVSDNGEGIPQENLSMIFEPFFSTKGGSTTTGLGLASVKRLVRGLGGAIAVDSTLGEGTSFRVYLPLTELRGGGIATSSDISHRPVRILVVDDEASLLDLHRQVLERLGYNVHVCEKAEDALEILRKKDSNFGMLLTDLMMPGMSGEDLVVILRDEGNAIPVVVCTAMAQRLSDSRCDELKIAAVMDKPLNIPDLALVIRDTLRASVIAKTGSSAN